MRRILHLGLGAFHRAHQAWYLHRLRQGGDRDWELAGANLRPDGEDLLQALAAQGCEYVLETVAPDGQRSHERIGSIGRVLRWEPALEPVIACGAAPQTRIISFTVTEAGYHLSHRGGLDFSSADLAADLAGPSCLTLYGTLAAILRRRLQQGSGPVTLLSCDNLRGNGERLRGWLLQFLDRRGESALSQWVRENAACPNSMVDRITPRPPPELRQRVLEATGFDDAVPVMSESHAQWVVEDNFAAGRPAWEAVGVQMVGDVAPYEEAKIRVLNGSHSCIGWAGILRGHRWVHESARDRAIRDLASAYVDDVIPCLQPSPVDLPAYRDLVLRRFGNPHIEDRNERICSDSFAKLPGFVAPTIHERLAQGLDAGAVCRVAALLLLFLERWHRGALPFEYSDQAMDEEQARAIFHSADPLRRFCDLRTLWGELAGSAELVSAMRAALPRASALLGLDECR